MADFEKSVLFDLQIKDDAVIKSTLEIDENIKKINENTKLLSENYDKNAESIKANQLRVQTLAKEKGLLNSVTLKEIEANRAASGSLNQMKAQIIVLTAAYDKLSKEERENLEIGGKLQRQIRNLSDELKNNKDKIGDNRLSVGAYKQAILEAAASSGKFGQGINAISVAFKANPIGLVITAFTVLLPLLNKSGEGADFLAKSFAQVTAVFEVIIKRAFTLGSAIAELFQGNFTEATKLAGEAMSDFSGSIQTAWKEAGELADALDELEAIERKQLVTQKQTETQIKQLLIQAKNRQLSEDVRIKLLEKAEGLEKGLIDQQLANAQKRLDFEKRNNALRQEDRDEQEQREAELAGVIEDIRQRQSEFEEKVQVRKDALSDAAKDRSIKRAQEEAKAREEIQKAELERTIKHLNDIELIAREEYRKSLQEQAELQAAFDAGEGEFARQGGSELQQMQDRNRKLSEERKKDLEDQRAIDQAKIGSAYAVSDALSDVVGAFVENAKTATDIQKGITLVQIAIDTASAISSLTRNAEGNPLNLATAGIAGVIQFTTGLAKILANIAKAKQLLSGASFYEGGEYGYTGDGNPREESNYLGQKPYTYHKRELIVNHDTLETPAGMYHGAALLALMKKNGAKLKGMPGFATGGTYFDGGYNMRMAGITTSNNNAIADAAKNSISKAFEKVNISVAVSEINQKQNDLKYVKVKDGLNSN